MLSVIYILLLTWGDIFLSRWQSGQVDWHRCRSKHNRILTIKTHKQYRLWKLSPKILSAIWNYNIWKCIIFMLCFFSKYLGWSCDGLDNTWFLCYKYENHMRFPILQKLSWRIWVALTSTKPNITHHRADTRFAPSQWETVLLCKDVSNWLGVSLESMSLAKEIDDHH